MIEPTLPQGPTANPTAVMQILATEQLAADVRNLVAQLNRLLPTSDLPALVQDAASVILDELRAAAFEPTPNAMRMRRGLRSLKQMMEVMPTDLIAVGVVSFITPLIDAA